MSGINKQPVFTDIPVLKITQVNITSDNNANPIGSAGNPTSIVAADDVYGTLIERITVTATADTKNYPDVLAKLVYLYIGAGSKWVLYKTAAMPATTVTDTVPPPEIEWVFTGGLLLPEGVELAMAASRTLSDEGGGVTQADQLAVTVEGSSYSQPE
jgi:hypothetical protein